MTTLPNEREFGAVFPDAEYDERRRRVRESMARRGVDLLLVTSPRNVNYLTGFDSIWFYHATPTCLALRADRDEVVFFDSYHVRMANEFCYVDEALFFGFPQPREDAVAVIVDALRDRGLLRGAAAVEMWAHNPSPALLNALRSLLESAGCDTVDGSWIVDDVAMVKSPLEIACMRKAAGIADVGMLAGRDTIEAGVTEIDVMSEIHYAMGRAGGEDAALRTAITCGPISMPHKPSTRHRVEQGDTVFADICGVFNRYHANLCRFFSLGRQTDAVHDRAKLLADCLPAVIDAVRPGDPVNKIGDVMQQYLDDNGLTDVANRTGYSLGISIPPDWVGHVWLSDTGFVDADFVPGTIMNYEVFSSDPTMPRIGYIDTLLMTNTGIEVLSNVPQELLVA